MAIRIETDDRLSIGDHVERDGGQFVVTEAAVWSDALDRYAYTEATLEPAGGDDDAGEVGDQ
jgi:hypothetical protein